MDKYEVVKDLGSGNFGVARLLRHKDTKELVAMKYIERGHRIDENVAREIINHRSLRHPNIIRFKEAMMEYAAGGELFERICNAGRFSEDEARYFFQQLISGVNYCHSMQICHRDLKLENTLLDGSPAPRLKICDFGYSKACLYAVIFAAFKTKVNGWYSGIYRTGDLTDDASTSSFLSSLPNAPPHSLNRLSVAPRPTTIMVVEMPMMTVDWRATPPSKEARFWPDCCSLLSGDSVLLVVSTRIKSTPF
ncbi:hypothetical protein TIFTF001_007648 [Ficus carica]|uniref:non-specific serine/threonine protein kinase n=1 Tax=Ficus carica TaxID=3494 RepID=A0AA87ZRL9_FICCA|nr:hypothetical protein TIFTF001_007648 [Ficus carica]